jgi:acyl-CoA synthetase (AMP-forming)/AMP-acid ligase II
MTLGSALVRSAARFPQKRAVQDHRAHLSYADFNSRVNRLAGALTGLGLVKGDRLVTLSNNCLELMQLYLAALKLGVIVCPLDTRGTREDHAALVELVDPRGLAFHPDQAGRAEELTDRLERDAPRFELDEKSAFGGRATGELVAAGADQEPDVPVAEGDDAFILFTGGTTGTPKGVVLTHRNLLFNAINVVSENRSPDPDAVIVYPMQIYHSGALSRFLATIYAGGTFIALPKFDAAVYLDTVEAEGGTFMVGNQAIWHMLLDENAKRRRNTASITSWLHAQGNITPEFKDRIQAELFPGAGMYASYALTEASPGVTVLRPTDRPREWPGIGRPYISIMIRLAGHDDTDVPTGEVGQILVRGPNVMRCYWNSPDETEAALAGGWLHTGDLGRADDLGFLYFVERLKDVIKSGGLNVYAREVEAVILDLPAVAEVAVIGVDDPKWGETVRAVVVIRPGARLTEPEVIEHCRLHLAGYKKPTSVVFAENLPKTGFGSKLNKPAIRRLYGRPEAVPQERGGQHERHQDRRRFGDGDHGFGHRPGRGRQRLWRGGLGPHGRGPGAGPGRGVGQPG